jgi:hypothetical protein
MRAVLLVLLMACTSAFAQMPRVEKLSRAWFNDKIEFELRLKTTSASGAQSTAKLITKRFANINARYYTHTEPCWNKTSACPKIDAVTARAYLTLPWLPRTNITKFLLCNASECALSPWAIPIQAKPGEGYFFDFDRVGGEWRTVPSVVKLP